MLKKSIDYTHFGGELPQKYPNLFIGQLVGFFNETKALKYRGL